MKKTALKNPLNVGVGRLVSMTKIIILLKKKDKEKRDKVRTYYRMPANRGKTSSAKVSASQILALEINCLNHV
jgi:hypothetical protein